MPNDNLQKANRPKAGEAKLNQQLFSITELARDLSISTRTIRFYESKGLIFPDRVGGNRVFQHRDRVRLHLILRGKRLGFTLKDISEYLSLYDTDRSQISQLQLLQSKVDERLDKLHNQLHDLQTTIAELQEMQVQTRQHLNRS